MDQKTKSNLNRRQFVASLGVLGVVGLSPKPAFSLPEFAPENTGNILKCGPYLQAAFAKNITVRWITNTLCHSWVEYGSSPDNLDNIAQTIDDGLIQANNTVHAITLTSLNPGSTYYYRVVSKNIDNFHPYKLKFGETFTSKVYSFVSQDDQKSEFEFLVFNDIHDRPESFAALAKYQNSVNKDFIFLNGDMFNWQIDEDQLVDHLLKPLCEVYSAAEIPFIFSRGNHETRGQFARQLGDYFDGREQKFYYSFQKGPLYVIVLDSGEDKDDAHAEYGGIVSFDTYRLKQKIWLEKELQKREFKKAKYKMVFSHIPFYYSGDQHGIVHCREHWGPLLNKAKIDLLVSGHTHRHGIHPPVEGQHNYPIVIGGGKTDGTRTVMNVKVGQNALNLQMFDDTRKLVGALNL